MGMEAREYVIPQSVMVLSMRWGVECGGSIIPSKYLEEQGSQKGIQGSLSVMCMDRLIPEGFLGSAHLWLQSSSC